jgi:hypothetical protein
MLYFFFFTLFLSLSFENSAAGPLFRSLSLLPSPALAWCLMYPKFSKQENLNIINNQ